MKIKKGIKTRLGLFAAAFLININALAGDTYYVTVSVSGTDEVSNLVGSKDGMTTVQVWDSATLKDSDFSDTTFTHSNTVLIGYASNGTNPLTTSTLENVDFSNSIFYSGSFGVYTGTNTPSATNPYSSAYLKDVNFSGASFIFSGNSNAIGVNAYQSTWENVCYDNVSMYLDGTYMEYAFWFSSVKLSDSSFRNMEIEYAGNATYTALIGISGNLNNWTTISDVDFRGSTFAGELMSTDSFTFSSDGSKAELNNIILGDGTIYSSGEIRWKESDVDGGEYKYNNDNYFILVNDNGDCLYAKVNANKDGYDYYSYSDGIYTLVDNADGYNLIEYDLALINTGLVLSSQDDTLTIRKNLEGSDIDVRLTIDSNISEGSLLFEDAGKLVINDEISLNLDTNAEIKFQVEEGFASIEGGSIASKDSTATISKTGAGALTVNSSMAYYLGALNIEEGSFSYTNSAALALSSLNIYEDAVFAINATTLSNSSLNSFANNGTLILTGGELTNSLVSNSTTGSLEISGAVTSDVAISNALTITSAGTLSINADKLTSTSIANNGTISLSGGNLTNESIATSGNLEIAGIVANSVEISSDLSIATSGELTTDASLLLSDVSNEGSLTLTGEGESGYLSVAVTGEGDSDTVIIAGNITILNANDDESDSDTTSSGFISASSMIINDYASLTSNSANLTVDSIVVAENGSLVITGGVLDTDLSGDGDISFEGEGNSTDANKLQSNVSLSENSTLTITGDESGSGTLTSSINDEENAGGEVKIAGSITSSVDLYSDTFTVEENNTYQKSDKAENLAVYANTYNLEDGATVDVDTLSNVHSGDSDSSGITFKLGKNVSINSDVVANSPITYSLASGDENTVAVASVAQVGNISTKGTAGDESGVLTIESNITINLEGTITTGYTNATAADSKVVIEENSTLNFVNPSTDTALFSNVGTIENAGTISLENYADTVFVADADTVEANGIDALYSALNFNYNDLLIDTSAEGLTLTYLATDYFSSIAENANEEALAEALDAVDSSTANYSIDAASSTLKLNAKENGLSAYVMSSNSYIAEVNTMLLSNMNVANVNRARAILAKSAGAIESADVEVVEAEEVAQIKYSNVAQLQSINLLGSKDASNGVAGYDYWSVGSTANFDSILSDNALVGASIGGTYNKVSGDAGDNANSTTFLLNAYAVYANEGLELFGNIGYAHFWNEGSKAGSKADWDSAAFNALVGLSYDLETRVEGLTITPLAMLNLVCLDADSASYSNGVTVDAQSYFSAKIILGFEVEYAISSQFNAIIRAMYAHECGDTSYDNTYGISNILNGLSYVGGEAGADSAIMGLGLSYDFSETCSLYFDYNAYIYSELITHSLNFSLGIKF